MPFQPPPHPNLRIPNGLAMHSTSLTFQQPESSTCGARFLMAVAVLGAISFLATAIQELSTNPAAAQTIRAPGASEAVVPASRTRRPATATAPRSSRMGFPIRRVRIALFLASRPGAMAPRLEGRWRSPLEELC